MLSQKFNFWQRDELLSNERNVKVCQDLGHAIKCVK